MLEEPASLGQLHARVTVGVGQLAHQFKKPLTWIAGIVIIIFGLHLTGIFKIKALYADKRLHAVKGGKSPIGAFLVGFAFAFGWTPCLGPYLSVILGFAGNTETVTKGVLLLWVYSMGLAVPFLLTSVAIDRFMEVYGRFRKYLRVWEFCSGVILILLGALILTRRFTVLSSYLGFLNRFSL